MGGESFGEKGRYMGWNGQLGLGGEKVTLCVGEAISLPLRKKDFVIFGFIDLWEADSLPYN